MKSPILKNGMNKTLIALLAASVLGLSTAHADESKTSDPAPQKGSRPCEPFVKACRAGGFEPGKHKEGKGLWKDCVAKLLEGESVTGVTVQASPEQVSACKAKKPGIGKGKRGGRGKQGGPKSEGGHAAE